VIVLVGDFCGLVPAALLGLVTSARATYRAMRANGCYPAIMAVGAVEDTVATLARISADLEGYVGDCSGPGGKAMVRAYDLLGQARGVLSDARHHLALDDTDEPELDTPGSGGAVRLRATHRRRRGRHRRGSPPVPTSLSRPSTIGGFQPGA
jgi:hypothetical protein